MTASLRPYPSYKDSGVEWLGKLPDQWGRRPLKRLVATPITDGPHETPEFTLDGIPFLSVDSIVEGRLDFTSCRFISVADHERYCRKCRPTRNDVLVGKAASVGKIAVVDVDFEFNIWSPLAMLRPAPRLLVPQFLYYYLLSRTAQDEILLQCTHNTQNNISMDDIGELAIPLPDPPEQQAIAAFLDRETQRIDALVEKKKELVELLQEKRTALISHAVTKGLDPNVRMKDSGVEWLGKIPQHWEATPLRRHWDVLDCKHVTVPFFPDGIPLVSVSEVQGSMLDLSCAKRTTREYVDVLVEGGRRPRRGDLIYCRNTSLGAAAYVNTNEELAMGQDVCLIRTKTQNNRFLNYQLHSTSAAYQTQRVLVGSTINRINVAVIRTLVLAVPPRDEQDRIVLLLDRETQRVDTMVEKVRRSIELLKEYRTALISAAVTGKIDVRGVA